MNLQILFFRFSQKIVVFTTIIPYNINMFEECLYFNSNSLARTIEKIWNNEYKKYNLSVSHAFLLRLILNSPGLNAKEIAEQLNLEKSTVTRFLDRLEHRRFILRKENIEDARERRIFPTKKAKDIHDELDQIGKKLTKEMYQRIGQAKVQDFVADLREIQKNIHLI